MIGNDTEDTGTHVGITEIQIEPRTLMQAVCRGDFIINTTLAFAGCARPPKRPDFRYNKENNAAMNVKTAPSSKPITSISFAG